MKHTIQIITYAKATFSFEGGYEEIFAERPRPDFVSIQQDGDQINLPTADFRAFLKALSDWADAAGIPA
jgi:hypothetical protein